MHAPRRSFTLQQAFADSQPLARLSALVRESAERLAAVQQLIPPTMRTAIRPGPIDENGWCLLVDNSAVAAKLRHLAPLLQQALGNRGLAVTAIRVKIQKRL